MSGSQQKKNRAQERETGADRRLAEKKKAIRKAKRERRIVAIVCIVLVLVVAVLLVFNSSLLYSNFAAVRIGDVSYTAADFSFFYKSAYHNYAAEYRDYLSYMGLDTNYPLSVQTYPYGEFDTWADYFKDSAVSNMKNVTMLYTRAQEAGYTLDSEQQAELDEVLDSYATSYEQSEDYNSADKYLAAVYGKGTKLSRIRELVTMIHIAGQYGEYINDSFEYTAGDLNAKYQEDKDNYDTFEFMYHFVSGAADTDNGIDSETAMAAAKETAEAILADAKEGISAGDEDETAGEDAFSKAVADNTESEASSGYTRGSSLTGVHADWLKDSSRKSGDMEVIEDSTGYYVVLYLGRDVNDYKTVAVRHILVKAEADEEGAYTGEAKDAAREEAERILAEWKAGEATEDSFAALAEEYSDDRNSSTNELSSPGGLYENFAKKSMVEEFDEWAYDPARKAGDTGIVYNEGGYTGYHIIYFVGYGGTYRDYLTETDLRNADYAAWNEEQLEGFTAKTGFTARLVK